MRAFANMAVVAMGLVLGAAACSGGASGNSADSTGHDGGATVPEAAAPLNDATSPADGGPNATVDAPTEANTDGDPGLDAAPVYPAPHPATPQILDFGTTMKAPKVTTVSFVGDPLQPSIDAFATAIGTTTYWGDRVKEYGIGALTPEATLHDPTTWTGSVDDTQISSWLVTQLGATGTMYPAPDDNTVYALYFPPNVTVTMDGETSCTTFHGYHSQTAMNGQKVVYAVISRCASLPEIPNATGIQYVSAVASHELIEAITDPFPIAGPFGYAQPDDDHIAFDFIGLGELMDMCTLVGNAFYTPTDFPYTVQRIWSNAVAPTGHDPCLPELAGHVYFNTAPVLSDTVHFMGGASTKGALIPVGQTKTIELDLFSEAPTAGPWNVKVIEDDGETDLDMSLDKTSGQNGDKLELTVKVNKQNAAYGAEIFVIQSSLGSDGSLWVGMIGNE